MSLESLFLWEENNTPVLVTEADTQQELCRYLWNKWQVEMHRMYMSLKTSVWEFSEGYLLTGNGSE